MTQIYYAIKEEGGRVIRIYPNRAWALLKIKEWKDSLIDENGIICPTMSTSLGIE